MERKLCRNGALEIHKHLEKYKVLHIKGDSVIKVRQRIATSEGKMIREDTATRELGTEQF